MSQLVSAALGRFRARLLSEEDADGDALIIVKRSDIATAAAMTLHQWVRRGRLNVLHAGVVGDGVADDAPALNALGALGIPLDLPKTAGDYKIGSTVTLACDVYSDGTLRPTPAVGAAPAVILSDSGYIERRTVSGLRIIGDAASRAAGVMGLRNDCNNSVLFRCRMQTLAYGIVARGYSQTYDHCSVSQCLTNFSAYARSFVTEINALNIIGGSYDSAVNVALNIGDTSWPDALAAGNSHGVVINILNGVATDGAESRIDNCANVLIEGTYAETTNTDALWRLGGAGDGFLRDVTIRRNFFKQAKNAVRCASGVQGLKVHDNFLSAITQTEVRMSTDIYGVDYSPGTQVGCFAEGQAVGLAFRSLPVGSVNFGAFSLAQFGLIAGVQTANFNVQTWFPGGVYRDAITTCTMNASSGGAFKTTPVVGKAGVVAANVFTFTTKADAYGFNGGDRIVTAPVGAAYVRSVDYDAGTMLMDGGVTANGAAVVGQVQAAFHSQTSTGTGAAPVGTTPLGLPWQRGDTADNLVAAVGVPKGWINTAAGLSWQSRGNL